MALAGHSSSMSNWGRWSQQLPQDYTMMDTSILLPFDSRGHQATLQRPLMAPQYLMPSSYSIGAVPTMPTTHQQPVPPYMCTNYHSPPPSTPSAPAPRRTHHDRPHSNISPEAYRSSHTDFSSPHDHRVKQEIYMRSPVSIARSNSVSSVATASCSNPLNVAKTVTHNLTINPEDQINFNTDVDELMKSIQQNSEDGEDQKDMTYHCSSKTQHYQHELLTPAHTPQRETQPREASPVISPSTPAPAPARQRGRKKWFCNGPSCKKGFVQKTHLEIHRRVHTGQRPYVCRIDGCDLTFSQRGNLKTHERRHTGEKPFPCPICGKRFAQRGNVRSHEQTHEGLKPYICRLDDCNKPFSQLGNMKTHQNNFHKSTLQNLKNTFAKCTTMGTVPEELQELVEYFREHYKNSNKGIKGRGKARSVAAKKSIVDKPRPHTPASQSQQLTACRSIADGMDHSPTMISYALQQQVSPPEMIDQLSRTHLEHGYPTYGLQQHHAAMDPSQMMYAEVQARHMVFGDRLF